VSIWQCVLTVIRMASGTHRSAAAETAKSGKAPPRGTLTRRRACSSLLLTQTSPGM